MSEQARKFDVRVLKPDYSGFLGSVAAYETVSVTWQNLGIGTASLVAAEEGVALEALNAYRQPVPITFKAPGLPRWSGRVVAAIATKESGKAGQLVITLVDENKMLLKILLAPVPESTSSWANQGGRAYDTRTGPLRTVAKAYLQAAITRLAGEGRPVNLVVAPNIGTDDSPTVTMKVRAKTYDEVFTPVMRRHGYDTRVTLWLPGDPAPLGLTLTTPTFVADVVPGRDQRYVIFADERGGMIKRVITSLHPDTMSVVVGGPGDLTERVFQKVMADDGRVAVLGGWGYPEEWLDATGEDDAAGRTARGLERLGELAGKTSISAEIQDGVPWHAGPDLDYWIGDRVRAAFSGVSVTDLIDRVTVTDSPDDGYKVQATFGSARDTETSDVRLARTVGELAHRLRGAESGR